MVDALGGEAGLREARSLEAAGSAEIFTGDGKRTAYSLQFRLHLPDQAIFRVRGASLTYDFAFTGGQYNSNGKIKGDDAQRLETIFRAFREYQLPALLERVAGYRFSAARVIPVAGEDYFLLADGGAEKITLALDKESRPQFVTLENRSGLGSGDTITYSAYSRQGGGVLPMVTHIRLQDAGRTGLEIRLDRLSVNRNFTAKDFQIRRNSFR
jgi:hypothetical protein